MSCNDPFMMQSNTYKFRRRLAVLLAGLLANLSLPAQQPFVLTDGTPLRLRLNRNLSSADARIGEPVDFEVLEDVMLNGTLVIKRGNTALATVTEAKQKGRMGKAGKLNVNIDYARSIVGEKIMLRAVKENEGGANTGKMTGAIVATSIVFFPAAPLFLFMKGKDITSPQGTEMTAYVHGDVRLDEARFRAHPLNAGFGTTPAPQTATSVPAPSATSPKTALSNSDVLDLKKAGFSDDLIVSKIRSSNCAFRLETTDMIELKRAGLSEKVIGAILEKAQ
jgi:hypothetical protein